MEDKPQNVFGKLDIQQEKIDDISSKLEGISVEDLYALAKRTWDYEDYTTAQKYYNHISLLRPLDWEAPLYASLCNFRGPRDVDFWEYGLEKAKKVLISNIDYINNLDKPIEEKNKEMTKCINIIKDFMLCMKNMYFKNKDIFDTHIPDFVCKLESFFYDICNKTVFIELDSLKSFGAFISDNVLDLIKKTNKISSDITKETFNKLIQLSKNEYNIDYDYINSSNKTESVIELSVDEKKEIMLKGTMYFEYTDKIIANKIFKRTIILGLILTSISVAGIVVSFLGNRYWTFAFMFQLFYGILLLIKAFTQRDRIKCSSLLSGNRLKNRLTSNGNITLDNKFDFMRFISILGLILIVYVNAIMAINVLGEIDITKFAIVFVVLDALNIIAYIISLKSINGFQLRFSGKYTYLYNGKFYEF